MPKMPGNDVKHIRELLGLNQTQFATVLGVNPATLYRWESAGDQNVTIDGTPWNILAVLRERIRSDKKSRAEAKAAGSQIANFLLVAGVVVALGALIAFAVKNSKVKL